LIRIFFNKISFVSSDLLEITLDWSESAYDLSSIRAFNVSISKVDLQRNESVFGFGTEIKATNEKKIQIERKLDNVLQDGIYFIESLSWNTGNEHKIIFCQRDFELKLFVVQDFNAQKRTEKEIEENAKLILIKRKQYREFNFITEKSKLVINKQEFRILIFCSDCLIHSIQELKGITIFPILETVNYSNLKDPVNNFLKKHYGFTFRDSAEVEEKFKNVNHLFCIEFFKIVAIDSNDGVHFCINESENIFSILGFKQGRRPHAFAYVVINLKNDEKVWSFKLPYYKGNLVSGFSRTGLTRDIDELQSSIKKNPTMKFLLDNYAFVQNENNLDIQCLRLWSILEFIANSKIKNDINLLDSEMNLLKDKNSNILNTNEIQGKVYKLIYDSNLKQHTISFSSEQIIFETNYKMKDVKATKIISLWEFVNAVYLIRNKVAHIGKFDLIKYKERSGKFIIPVNYYFHCINFLDSIAKHIIATEFKKAITEE
jgi:hypothetical protein